MLNQVRLIGRLMGAPKLLDSPDAPTWAVGLETAEPGAGHDGHPQDIVDWHELRLQDADALALVEAATEGDLLYVEGQLRTCPAETGGVSFLGTVIEVSRWTMPLAGHGVPASSRPVRSRWSRVSRGARRFLAFLVPRGFQESRVSRAARWFLASLVPRGFRGSRDSRSIRGT
jgi:hypothetical protein